MRIAVVQHIDTGYFSDYISSLIDEAAANAGYEIKTYRDSVPVANQYISENAVVYILMETQNPLMLKWSYAVKLKTILNKLKASVVIDLNGVVSTTKIPQLLVFDQSFFLDFKSFNNINKYAVKNISTLNNTVKSIIVCDENNAQQLQSKYKINQQPQVIYFSAQKTFKKFEWHEKIMIKAMQSDNNDYFLSVINDEAEEDFVLILKAFSKFKKWQQSSMKLILLPKFEKFSNNILSKLDTYKYRDDVKLPEDLDETSLVALFASAHSLIHATNAIADLMIISIALQCAVPIISFKNNDVEEYAGDAALFVEENNFELTGEAIIKLYKDEKLHEQLKEAAEIKAQRLKREDNQTKLWQLILNATNN